MRIGCQGSHNVMTESMDEVLHELQSMEDSQHDVTSESSHMMCKSHKVKNLCITSLKFYLNQTHSFATHIIKYIH